MMMMDLGGFRKFFVSDVELFGNGFEELLIFFKRSISGEGKKR